MSDGILTKDNNTVEFKFMGSCYICLTGSGSVSIQRKMGGDFVNLTTERGEELIFVGEGVLFNNKIEDSKRQEHRIVADTTKIIEYSIVPERV